MNQSYCIIRTFDIRRTLPKYLRTFLHENAVLMIGLTDQSGYSICLLYGQTFHPYSRKKPIKAISVKLASIVTDSQFIDDVVSADGIKIRLVA